MKDWTFDGTWPYEPKWFETDAGRMHYIDEGEGRPVVMVHGNPTWGYLYRNFVSAVVDAGYRAIVMDHLGFGRSDKPDRSELYSIRNHGTRCTELLESLDLSEATIVIQDWGGPIGMAWASSHPERVRSLCVLNTFAHRPKQKVKLPTPLRLFRTPLIGEFMVKGLHAFVKVFLFKEGVVKRERMTPLVRSAYLAPHPTWGSRTSILVFPREIPAGPDGDVSDYLGEIEARMVPAFADKPIMIAWPMQDIAFTPDMLDEFWLADFPDAEVHRISDAGHYIQEDAHEEVIPKLLEFLRK